MEDKESEISVGDRAWAPSIAEVVLSVMFGVLFIVEIVACFFLYYNFYSLSVSLYIGWAILILGLLMMTFPRYELSKSGDVPNGKSWVHTTTVVDWITILLGALPFASVVYYAYVEDRNNREKFGQPYVEYSRRVPMMNFILGTIRRRHRT